MRTTSDIGVEEKVIMTYQNIHPADVDYLLQVKCRQEIWTLFNQSQEKKKERTMAGQLEITVIKIPLSTEITSQNLLFSIFL